MDNQSGKTFENAKIKLMAGDVSKIQEAERFALARSEELAVSGRMAAPVTEKAFEDYHLYNLARRRPCGIGKRNRWNSFAPAG